MHCKELLVAIKFIKSMSNLPTLSFLLASSLDGAKKDKLGLALSLRLMSFNFYRATYFSDSEMRSLSCKSFILLLVLFIKYYNLFLIIYQIIPYINLLDHSNLKDECNYEK